MKKYIYSLVFVFALFLPISALGQSIPKPIDFGPKEELVILSGGKKHIFNVEIADTPIKQNRGLMFRDVIDPKSGMLFEFGEEKIASIWMKNTSIFLDVLFIRKDGTILKIEHSAKPYSLRSVTSEAPVTAVLELAGGAANELGIKPGDKVLHEYFSSNQ